MNLLQTISLAGRELERVLLCGREDLAGLRRVTGTRAARRRTEWGEDGFDLFLLRRVEHFVKTDVDGLLESEHVFLLVVCHFQAVLIGEGHDLAGLRRSIEPVATPFPRPLRGLLFLICCEELIQVGVDVFLDLVELLLLVGGDPEHFPRDRRHDLPRPRRRAMRHAVS